MVETPDAGGLVVGTDMCPNCSESLFERMSAGKSFVIQDAGGTYYNGMSFAHEAYDSRFRQILEIVLKYPTMFGEKQVPAVTGPLRWTSILKSMDHGLDAISDKIAWTRSYWERHTTRPTAWVDPGFAASHLTERNPQRSK